MIVAGIKLKNKCLPLWLVLLAGPLSAHERRVWSNAITIFMTQIENTVKLHVHVLMSRNVRKIEKLKCRLDKNKILYSI